MARSFSGVSCPCRRANRWWCSKATTPSSARASPHRAPAREGRRTDRANASSSATTWNVASNGPLPIVVRPLRKFADESPRLANWTLGPGTGRGRWTTDTHCAVTRPGRGGRATCAARKDTPRYRPAYCACTRSRVVPVAC